RPESFTTALIFQCVTLIVSPELTRPEIWRVTYGVQQLHRRGTTALSPSIFAMKRPTITCLAMVSLKRAIYDQQSLHNNRLDLDVLCLHSGFHPSESHRGEGP